MYEDDKAGQRGCQQGEGEVASEQLKGSKEKGRSDSGGWKGRDELD